MPRFPPSLLMASARSGARQRAQAPPAPLGGRSDGSGAWLLVKLDRCAAEWERASQLHHERAPSRRWACCAAASTPLRFVGSCLPRLHIE